MNLRPTKVLVSMSGQAPEEGFNGVDVFISNGEALGTNHLGQEGRRGLEVAGVFPPQDNHGRPLAVGAVFGFQILQYTFGVFRHVNGVLIDRACRIPPHVRDKAPDFLTPHAPGATNLFLLYLGVASNPPGGPAVLNAQTVQYLEDTQMRS